MDILKQISAIEDLIELQEMYVNVSYAPYIHSFLKTAIEWKKQCPNENYISIYSPDGWKNNGTFVAHIQISCNEFIVFTKEESCNELYEVLKKTELFDWKNKFALFYAIHSRHQPTVIKALKERNVQLSSSGNCYNVWWLPNEKAKQLEIDCPPDLYIDKLKEEQVSIANDVWPNRFDGSLNYLNTFRKFNSAYGVMRKSDNELLSWVFKVYLRTMAALQTAEGHERKGYASLVIKRLCKDIAEEGYHPMAMVNPNNKASASMFQRLGFTILDQVYYTLTGPQ